MISPSLLVLPEDPKEAKNIFNSLPIKNQLDIFLQARGKERLHYLFLSENPEQLVQKLPELELFLTVQEVGEKDALDLILLTTQEQFQYLLDLDLWKKDQLDPEKILLWMEILLECDEEKVIQFIRFTDPELIALILKKLLLVKKLEGEPLEARDQIPLFTMDQHYFIDFKGKGTREAFQPFLQILYRVDSDGYRRLMESLIRELESELEETGYRLRNARMADYGFPDFEEALEIYRFVNPDALSLEARSPLIEVQEETERTNPIYYLTFQNEGPFLSSILSRIDDLHEQNRLKQEITALCNKAMMAEPIDLFKKEEMERVTKKVFHYLNLGLQYISQEKETKAFEFLRSLPIQKIFQYGVSATLLLKRKAESILNGLWFNGDKENLVFLDTPHLEKFEGILKKRPVFYRDGGPNDFKSLQDLKEAEIFLESTQVITNFLREKLNVTSHWLRELDLTEGHPEVWRGITLSTIFLTSLANQILKGSFQFEAIEKAQLKNFFSHIFNRDEQGKGVVKMEIKNGLKEWLDSIENDEQKRQHLLAFWDFCIDLLENEYGRIPPEEDIDPRFVKGFLVHK